MPATSQTEFSGATIDNDFRSGYPIDNLFHLEGLSMRFVVFSLIFRVCVSVSVITECGFAQEWFHGKKRLDLAEKGEPIDLLRITNVDLHTVHGNWKQIDAIVSCEPERQSRLLLPVSVSGNYTITIRFTRRKNTDTVGVIFPVGDSQVLAGVDYLNGKIFGLSQVYGKDADKLIGTTAVATQSEPATTGAAHEMVIKVSNRGTSASIQISFDGKLAVKWTGREQQLGLHGNAFLPNCNLLAIYAYNSIVDFEAVTLEVEKSGHAYQLTDDWESVEVLDQPKPRVAKDCIDWNGKKYFISAKPMHVTHAQVLARSLQGRLLTISSSDEEEFIMKQGRGLKMWMAGWRRDNSRAEWKDERLRSLRYFGKWASGQPDRWRDRQWNLAVYTGSENNGWHDVSGDWGDTHACIEWGEEYDD